MARQSVTLYCHPGGHEVSRECVKAFWKPHPHHRGLMDMSHTLMGIQLPSK